VRLEIRRLGLGAIGTRRVLEYHSRSFGRFGGIIETYADVLKSKRRSNAPADCTGHRGRGEADLLRRLDIGEKAAVAAE
jgi:hypothetical protein